MDLSGKQRRDLKARGQSLEPTLIVGKAGVGPATVEAPRRQLAASPLVKVRLPGDAPDVRRATAQELAAACEADFVAMVGRNALFYKGQSDEEPTEP